MKVNGNLEILTNIISLSEFLVSPHRIHIDMCIKSILWCPFVCIFVVPEPGKYENSRMFEVDDHGILVDKDCHRLFCVFPLT